MSDLNIKEKNKIKELIKNNKKFVTLVHRFPEGDALGSQLALSQLLLNADKEVAILNKDPLPWQYKFLPKSDLIEIVDQIDEYYDVGFVLDCSDFERTAFSENDRKKINFLVNIDHHLSNSFYGDLNYVNPRASSTGEMIYNLGNHLGFEINHDIALNLYAAIVTDTGSFRYSSTTADTFLIASKLVSKGIDIAWANENLFEIRSLGMVRLWGEALSKIEVKNKKLISLLTVTQRMLVQSDAEFSDDVTQPI